MKHKLIAVALIAVLLFMVLGNSIGCTTPTTNYTLTITSTAGGDVTAPVEGTHTYAAGTAVNLAATADAELPLCQVDRRMAPLPMTRMPPPPLP